MREEKRTAYEVDAGGIIFVVTVSYIVNGDGVVTHQSAPHRAPIMPGGSAPAGDEDAAALVALFYTPAFIAGYKARMAAALKADNEQRAATLKEQAAAALKVGDEELAAKLIEQAAAAMRAANEQTADTLKQQGAAAPRKKGAAAPRKKGA